MTPMFPPLKGFYNACMRGLMPARHRGIFGTPDEPLEFESGHLVPWWIEARWPMKLDLRFAADVETYFEDGWQVVRPIWQTGATLMAVADARGITDMLIVGAPTFLNGIPRGRPRKCVHGRAKLKLVSV